MRQIKNFMKAKKPMWRCGECECITLKCWKENDTFCNCGTSSEGLGVEYVFKDWDGKVLKKWSIDEWATPTPPADPTREWYTFTWWEPEVGPLSADATYVAQYELIIVPVTAVTSDILNVDVIEWQSVTRTFTYLPANANDLTGITFVEDIDASYDWDISIEITSYENGVATVNITWIAAGPSGYFIYLNWTESGHSVNANVSSQV